MEETKDDKKINEPENLLRTEWNDKLESTACDIGEAARSYRSMHIKVAQDTYRKYSILMYIGIILGPSAGIISSVNVIIFGTTYQHPAITVITAFLGFLSGVIIAIIKFAKFEEVSVAHKSAATKYISLEGNVRRQLALYREDRISAKEYLEWLNTSFDKIFAAAPLLNSSIYSKYSKTAKKNNMYIPSQYNMEITISGSKNDQNIPITRNSSVRTIEIPESCEQTSDKQKSSEKKKSYTFPDIEKHEDGLMNYEIKRMMGL